MLHDHCVKKKTPPVSPLGNDPGDGMNIMLDMFYTMNVSLVAPPPPTHFKILKSVGVLSDLVTMEITDMYNLKATMGLYFFAYSMRQMRDTLY